jgi:hypothetical protein
MIGMEDWTLRCNRLLQILMMATVLVFSFAFNILAQSESGDALHTPPKGSPERKAILDPMRQEFKEGQGVNVQFQVHHLKVHNGWAWASVTPLDENGKVIGELWPALLHNEGGKWVTKEIMGVAPDDDPVGPMDPSPKYVKALLKKFPDVPADIIPKHSGK